MIRTLLGIQSQSLYISEQKYPQQIAHRYSHKFLALYWCFREYINGQAEICLYGVYQRVNT